MHDHTYTPYHYCLWIFYIVSRGVHAKPKSCKIFSIKILCCVTGKSLSISSLNSDQSHSIQYSSSICMSDNFHKSFIFGSRNTHFLSQYSTSDFLYHSRNSSRFIGVFAMFFRYYLIKKQIAKGEERKKTPPTICCFMEFED